MWNPSWLSILPLVFYRHSILIEVYLRRFLLAKYRFSIWARCCNCFRMTEIGDFPGRPLALVEEAASKNNKSKTTEEI